MYLDYHLGHHTSDVKIVNHSIVNVREGTVCLSSPNPSYYFYPVRISSFFWFATVVM